MDCVVEFDFMVSGLRHIWVPIIGILFIIISIGFVRFNPILFWPESKILVVYRRILGTIFLLFSLVWTGTSGFYFIAEYSALRKQYLEGSYLVSEGAVQDYELKGNSDNRTEIFTVAGHIFSYSDNNLKMGYHRTADKDGAIAPGKYVKIWHADNQILRLEVCD